MTTADSDDTTGSALAEDLAAIDDLLSRAFPTERRRDATTDAGPSHHLVVLRESGDFWEDFDGEASRQAYADMESHLEALTCALTDRWGRPEAVDLGQYLTAGFGGAAVPEPIDTLCQSAVTLHVWRRPDADRWIGLAIGQGDKELPFDLFAAVGVGEALYPPAPGEY